ncbi:MAG: hypothetical protein DDT42_01576 [candidate division WS2 bacterium]|uniref:DUF86 domain-containing protein n=1 Tax=Psychracetigena formicireducens TaxID=2986056 RepID=A0A9E2BJ17_PSYF1|nr:hypothetical protein [Candidatus Psychracetigena formicireducens]MBT9145701.1 hypothetical protein [Candidatus Psychracetigena formicireducens]
MRREYKLFIQDILDSIKEIEEFVGDMDFNEFYSDRKTRSAVVLKIEIIEEATKNIPKEIKAKYKGLPWKNMAGMRDKTSHFYFGIDYKIVWNVIKKRLPEIKSEVENILKEMEKHKRNISCRNGFDKVPNKNKKEKKGKLPP